MKHPILAGLALAAGLSPTDAANVLHYWDMDTLIGGVPVDTIGGVPTSAGANLNLADSTFGPAGGSGGSYIRTTLGTNGVPLTADVFDGSATAMDFGTNDFSFSYWSFDDTGDGDVRGPRVFDNLATTTVGIQLGTNGANLYNLRIDDAAGGQFISNSTLTTLTLPGDQWVNVAVNVSRANGLAEIFFNGTSQGTFAVSTSGDIRPSQDLQIGAINGGANAGGLQSAGLDDLAFYDGLLNPAEITGLASGSLTPDQIPEPSKALLLGLSLLGFVGRRRR